MQEICEDLYTKLTHGFYLDETNQYSPCNLTLEEYLNLFQDEIPLKIEEVQLLKSIYNTLKQNWGLFCVLGSSIQDEL